MAGSQWHWGALVCVWLGGYFLARLIIFVFVDFRVFLRKICSMIPLIVFVFVDLRMFNRKICSMIALIIFVFGDLSIFYDRCIPSIVYFFCGEFGSAGRCHPKTACEKSARKKLQVRRRRPNTAGEKFAGEKV